MIKRKRGVKKVYLLPNLFTTANVFCGIFSMTLAINERFDFAIYTIFAGVFFDILDGFIARRHKSATGFGVQYDSLADLISFGIAPMIIVYKMELFRGANGRGGLAIAFLYSVCAALRLARFNSQPSGRLKRDFVGLPSPGAAGLLLSYILLLIHYQASVPYLKTIPILMIIVSYLMISNLNYPAVIYQYIFKKKPFIYLVIGTLIVVGTILFIHQVLFLLFLAYALSGPLLKVSYRWKRHRAMEFKPQEDTK